MFKILAKHAKNNKGYGNYEIAVISDWLTDLLEVLM